MALTSLYLDMKDKNVLIIGTGSVGIRRARRFLDAQANVNIVTKDIDEDIKVEANRGGFIRTFNGGGVAIFESKKLRAGVCKGRKYRGGSWCKCKYRRRAGD